MSTKVVNIEDTMPYVEEVRIKTGKQVYADSLKYQAQELSEIASEYRKDKEWVLAAMYQRSATELERIVRTSDPAKEIEDAMARQSRLYIDLREAAADAHRDTVNYVKRTNKERVEALEKAKAADDKAKAAPPAVKAAPSLVELRKQSAAARANAKAKGPLPKARPSRRATTPK